nr:MAG TPA: hypothetical protein [Caudoviricetes sp.]
MLLLDFMLMTTRHRHRRHAKPIFAIIPYAHN